jgi:NAD(P) transhydrogenase subunit alpha
MIRRTILLLVISAPGLALAQSGDLEYKRFLLLGFIFVLATFLGIELITKIPSKLHTPLMSGSNAISGVTVVGALIATGLDDGYLLTTVLGVIAVAAAMFNVVGGYLVTDRMLAMFKTKDKNKEGS